MVGSIFTANIVTIALFAVVGLQIRPGSAERAVRTRYCGGDGWVGVDLKLYSACMSALDANIFGNLICKQNNKRVAFCWAKSEKFDKSSKLESIIATRWRNRHDALDFLLNDNEYSNTRLIWAPRQTIPSPAHPRTINRTWVFLFAFSILDFYLCQPSSCHGLRFFENEGWLFCISIIL